MKIICFLGVTNLPEENMFLARLIVRKGIISFTVRKLGCLYYLDRGLAEFAQCTFNTKGLNIYERLIKDFVAATYLLTVYLNLYFRQPNYLINEQLRCHTRVILDIRLFWSEWLHALSRKQSVHY